MRSPADHDGGAILRRLLWYAAVATLSVRRHPRLFASVAAVIFAVAAGLLAVLPPTYEVRCRLVVRLPFAAAPRLDELADAPHRAAARLLLGEPELRTLAHEADLVEVARRRRPPLLRIVDRVVPFAVARDDPADSLIRLLEDRITAVAGRSGVVELTVRWTDAETAVELARAVQRRYLRIWQDLEVSSLSTVVDILERRVEAARSDVEGRVDRTRGALGGAAQGALERGDGPPREGAGRGSRREDDGDDAERSPGALPERSVGREGRIPRAVRSDMDLDTKLRMSALRLSLPLGDARDEAEPADLDDGARVAERGAPTRTRQPGELDRRAEDRLLESARSGVVGAEQTYAALTDRLEAARIELETSRAAFDERYIVVVPAAPPREPIRPDDEAVMLSALVDALLLAVVATALVDLRAVRRAGGGPGARGATP